MLPNWGQFWHLFNPIWEMTIMIIMVMIIISTLTMMMMMGEIDARIIYGGVLSACGRKIQINTTCWKIRDHVR